MEFKQNFVKTYERVKESKQIHIRARVQNIFCFESRISNKIFSEPLKHALSCFLCKVSTPMFTFFMHSAQIVALSLFLFYFPTSYLSSLQILILLLCFQCY